MLQSGLQILKKQLNQAKEDLVQLKSLRKKVEENTDKFIDDLKNMRLKIPKPQKILHIPSLEWVLARPKTKKMNFPQLPVIAFRGPENSRKQQEMEKRKARAQREKERRRKKKNLAILNGEVNLIGQDGSRVSGVHYLQTPSAKLERRK